MAKRDDFSGKWVWLVPAKAAIFQAYYGLDPKAPLYCLVDAHDALELLHVPSGRTLSVAKKHCQPRPHDWRPSEPFAEPERPALNADACDRILAGVKARLAPLMMEAAK